MMKKLIISLTLLFFSLLGFSQGIVIRTTGTSTVEDVNLFAGNSFRVPVFNDTTSANTAITLDSCGKIFFDRSINGFRVRKCNPKRWDYVTDSTVFATASALQTVNTNIRIALVDSVNNLKALISLKGNGSVDTVFTGFGIVNTTITNKGTILVDSTKVPTTTALKDTALAIRSIIGTVPTLAQVLTAGNNAGGNSVANIGQIFANQIFQNNGIEGMIDGQISIYKTGQGGAANLREDSVNTNQIYQFPNASGNIPLTVNGVGASATTGNITIPIGLSNINGLIAGGTNIALSGSGTTGSPYVINSTAPGTGTVTSITAGAALTGGTISTSGTIGADTSVLVTTTALKDSLINYVKAPIPNSSLQHSAIFLVPSNGIIVGSSNTLTLGNTVSIGLDTTKVPTTTALIDTAAALRAAIGSGGGGTVTSIATSTGILGGTITSTGTLKLDTTFALPRTDSIPSGYYPYSSNPKGYGTILSVIAGTDLTGGGSFGNIALNADTTTGSTKLATQGFVTRQSVGTDTTINITSVTPSITGKVKTFTIPYSAITGNKIVAGTNVTVSHNSDSSYTVNSTSGGSAIYAGVGLKKASDSSHVYVDSSIVPLISDVFNMPQYKVYVPSKGLAASSNVTNYNFVTLDSIRWLYAITDSLQTDHGGWLASSTSGDSIQVTAPFSVLIGTSIAAAHPWYKSGLEHFNTSYPDSLGSISYRVSQITQMQCLSMGIGGQTSTQIRARFLRDALNVAGDVSDGHGSVTLPNRPQFIIMDAIVNDPFNNILPTQTEANLLWMAQAAKEYKVPLILFNSIGQGNNQATKAQLYYIEQVNAWLASGALNSEGVTVIDVNSFWNSGIYGGVSAYYNDNEHYSSFVNSGDGIHFTKIGYDSVGYITARVAKLPVLDSITFSMQLSPSNPITNYNRPTNITIAGNAFTLANSPLVTLPVSSYFMRDSVWIKTVSSTNITGSSTQSGYNHILCHLNNNPLNQPWYTSKTNFKGGVTDLYSTSINLQQPSYEYPDTAIRVLLNNSSGGTAFQVIANNSGGSAVLNGITVTGKLQSAILSVYGQANNIAIATDDGYYAGKQSQLNNIQIGGTASAGITGNGINVFDNALTTETNNGHLLFGKWNTLGNTSVDGTILAEFRSVLGGIKFPTMSMTAMSALATSVDGFFAYDNTNHNFRYYKNTLLTPLIDSSSIVAGNGIFVTPAVGGILTIASKLQYAHTIFTPTTGGTVALVNNQYNIINPAGALLALTVNLPSSPANNDVVYIKYTQNVTTVTYGNGTVVDGITAPTAGGLTVLTYDSGTTSWY